MRGDGEFLVQWHDCVSFSPSSLGTIVIFQENWSRTNCLTTGFCWYDLQGIPFRCFGGETGTWLVGCGCTRHGGLVLSLERTGENGQ